jgi:uncharacterized protein YecE (DUF72 family)
MADARIGISGWTYGPWRGKFYPEGLPQNRELAYASRKLNSIEINGSFYSLQRPSSYQKWYDETPDDFVFSVKGGRFITHMKKLRDVDDATANFFASGILALKEKLGPILWQFPPNLGFDLERFEKFFQLLPRDMKQAARLAKKHTDKLKGRAFTRAEDDRPLRYAIEIRHASFMTEQFIDLLRRHNFALVFADTAGNFPYSEDVTADFIYARLHGAEKIYWSSYSDSLLDWWEKRIRVWTRGGTPRDGKCVSPKKPQRMKRDVYVYFDNDVKVAAPFDAMRLAERLGVVPETSAEADELVKSKRKLADAGV